MAAKFQNGDQVRQIMPAPVVGTVTRFVFDETTGEISYIVADADGHERAFRAEDIEAA